MRRTVAVVVALTLVGCSEAVTDSDSADPDETTTTAEAPEVDELDTEAEADRESQHHGIGDTAPTEGLDVTVHGVTDPYESTNEWFMPEDGMRWVGIDLTITNTTDEAEMFAIVMQLELFDTDHRAWGVVMHDERIASVGGDLQPGESRRGTEIFEVPTEVGLSHLVVKSGYGPSGVRFDLD